MTTLKPTTAAAMLGQQGTLTADSLQQGGGKKRHYGDQTQRGEKQQHTTRPCQTHHLLLRIDEEESGSLGLGQDSSSSSRRRDLCPLPLGITEVTGESGSGKTQLGLSLCVSTVMPCASRTYSSETQSRPRRDARMSYQQQTPQSGARQPTSTCSPSNSCASPRRAIFVNMGESVTRGQMARRLVQMIQTQRRRRQSHHKPNQDEPDAAVEEIMGRILIRSISNEEDFLFFLCHQLPSLLEQDVGVVVLDSIAGLYRTVDKDTAESTTFSSRCFFTQRSQTLFGIAARLKQLSETNHVPMVVMNQVTCTPLSHGCNKPALGAAWSSCVNARYVLRKSWSSAGTNATAGEVRRTIQVVLSSEMDDCSSPIPFCIVPAGAFSLE